MTFNPVIDMVWIAVAALLLLSVPLLLTSRNPRLRRRRTRVATVLLRMGTVLLLLLILANPVTKRGREQGVNPTSAVVLLDTSRSMALETPSRLQTAVQMLQTGMTNPASPVLVMPFDIDAKGAVDDLDSLADPPAGSRTNLGAALARALPLARSIPGRTIVVVSDGRVDDRDAVAGAALRAAASDVSVSVIPVGDPVSQPNLSVVNLLADRQTAPRSTLTVTAVVQASGCAARLVTVRLRDQQGRLWDEARFRATDGIHRQDLTATIGDANTRLIVDVVPLEDELTADDNQLAASIEVVDRPIRVLYMEGSNHKDKRWTDVWAYDFIGDALRQDPGIDVDIFTVDEQVAEGGRLFHVTAPQQGFPTEREALFAYDVIICSDINRSIFTDAQLAWTRELVAERGAGFCMIGGYTAYGAGKWDRTVWEQMIPVDMMTAAEGYTWEEVVPEIPPAAMEHPIWYMDPDPDANARILEQHPPFLGFNLVNKAKPAATVLAWHRERDMPLICVQPYGRGRSMAFLSDAAGGWGERYQTEWGRGERDNRYYRRFWVNAVRWLAQQSLSAHRTRLLATTDAVSYLPGNTIGVRAEKLGIERAEDLRGWTVTARLATAADETAVELALDEQTREFRGSLPVPTDLTDTDAAVQVTARGPGDQVPEQTRITVRIVGGDREWADPAPDHDLLAELARHTGGRVLRNAADLAQALRVDADAAMANATLYTVPLWDRTWIWALMVALLGAEWFLRKTARFTT